METKNIAEAFVKTIIPDGNKYQNILNDKNSSKMHSGFITLKPGEDVGKHTTGKNEELIVVIEGSGIIEAAGVKRNVKKGDIGYNPPDTEHNVINNSGETMQYIFVVSEA